MEALNLLRHSPQSCCSRVILSTNLKARALFCSDEMRLAAKPKQMKDSDGNLIHHEREGLYTSDEWGNPVVAQDDLTSEDYEDSKQME